MHGVIRKVSLTAAHQANDELDFGNLSTDVIVQFDNGDEYIATFLSMQNLGLMLDEHRNSPEYYSLQYYKILDAVLVNDFSQGDLLPVIEHMMMEGDFQVVFNKLSPMP